MQKSDAGLIKLLVSNGFKILKLEKEASVFEYWVVVSFTASGEMGQDNTFHSLEGYNITDVLNNSIITDDLEARVYTEVEAAPLIKVKIHSGYRFEFFLSYTHKNPLSKINRNTQ